MCVHFVVIFVHKYSMNAIIKTCQFFTCIVGNCRTQGQAHMWDINVFSLNSINFSVLVFYYVSAHNQSTVSNQLNNSCTIGKGQGRGGGRGLE